MIRYCAIWVLVPLFWLATTVYGAERHHIEQRPDNNYIAIFVHGLTGDYLKTWGKLPELLQADPSLNKYDFLFWGYPSSLFHKNEDIGTTGKHLQTEIDHLPKPYDKTVLIGHSMGGLVIRSYIVQALIDGKGNDLKTIADVILFGVPNEGHLKAQRIPEWVNDQIANLGVASQFISELHKYWIQRVTTASHNDDFHQAIPTVAVVGYHDHFVSRQSVESFFHETEMTDGDHRSMVKPETTSHLTYRIIHRRLIDAAKKPHRRVEKAREGTVIGQSVGRDVSIIYGISEEKFQRLSEELGVTKFALGSFFKTLQQQQVPLEDLDSTLRQIAKSYKDLQAKLGRFESSDPNVQHLKAQAKEALEAGDFALAAERLQQAKERDLQAIKQQQEALRQRQLSAAATNAELGELKNIELNYVKAMADFREADSLVPEGDHDVRIQYLDAWGNAAKNADYYAQAETPLKKALALIEKMKDADPMRIVQILNSLAWLYKDQGRYAEAESLFKRVLDIQEKEARPEYSDMVSILNSLAWLYQDQNRYTEAESLFKRALVITEERFGPEHPKAASSLTYLAWLYQDQNRYTEAESLFKRALVITEERFGLEHPKAASSLTNLAWLYKDQGRYAEAKSLFKRALDIQEKEARPEYSDMVSILNSLAWLYQDQNRYTEAESLFKRALVITEERFGPEHPKAASSLTNLAKLYQQQKRYSKAESLFKRSLAIGEKVLDPSHPNVATGLNNLAGLSRAQGRYEQAESLYQRALAIREKVLGPQHPKTLSTLRNYLDLLSATNRETEAKALIARFQLGIKLKPQDEPPGILVTQVMENSPAAQAGLQADDLIVQFNGHTVQDAKAFIQVIGAIAPETTIDVILMRSGQRHTLPVTIGNKPVVTPKQ